MEAKPRPARRASSTLPPAPLEARTEDGWAYGRYREPIARPRLTSRVREWMRLKEWHYTSVSSERLFLAFGLVQLHYAANAFVYVVDRERPSMAREYEAVSPLGRGLRFAESSIVGATRWRRKDKRIEVRYRGRWEVELDVTLGDLPLRGSFRLEPIESLALLTELERGRPAYTHKAAGLPVRGSVELGHEAIDLDGALATLDWTRSLARRETRWKWASFAGRSDGGVVGLNLSAEVYDDDEGNSRENAIWVDGRVRPLGGVRFEVPPNPGVDDWRITSRDGDEVDLRFEPLGARAQHLDLKLVKSDFVQPYGLFRGRVAGQSVHDVFGVVEDHLSVW